MSFAKIHSAADYLCCEAPVIDAVQPELIPVPRYELDSPANDGLFDIVPIEFQLSLPAKVIGGSGSLVDQVFDYFSLGDDLLQIHVVCLRLVHLLHLLAGVVQFQAEDEVPLFQTFKRELVLQACRGLGVEIDCGDDQNALNWVHRGPDMARDAVLVHLVAACVDCLFERITYSLL